MRNTTLRSSAADAEARSRRQAKHHIQAALSALEQIGPQSVGIGKGIMDAEEALRTALALAADKSE